MAIRTLDHCSIRTFKLPETERFYVDVMGFEVGPRPSFPFPGVWLYQGEQAVVHVIGIDPNDREGLAGYLGDKGADDATGTGTIDSRVAERVKRRLFSRGRNRFGQVWSMQ